MKILDSFSLKESELNLSEITRKTDLPKPTVYRILETLCEYRLLARDKDTLKYRIGIKFFEIGSLYMSSLKIREIAFPQMDELQHLTG